MVAEERREESKTNVLHPSGNKERGASRKFARAQNSLESTGLQRGKTLMEIPRLKTKDLRFSVKRDFFWLAPKEAPENWDKCDIVTLATLNCLNSLMGAVRPSLD